MKKLNYFLLSLLVIIATLDFVKTSRVYAQLPSYSLDPCASNGSIKLSTFANITTATTTQLVALVAGKQVFVCGFSIDMTGSATADTVILVNGTGASCGTGTTSLTPTYSSGALADAYKLYGGGLMSVITVPAGNALCVTTTVGTTPTIGILVTYVQQ